MAAFLNRFIKIIILAIVAIDVIFFISLTLNLKLRTLRRFVDDLSRRCTDRLLRPIVNDIGGLSVILLFGLLVLAGEHIDYILLPKSQSLRIQIVPGFRVFLCV